MHLRPCRHCEAVNARAASHCHQCGEAFELAFPADEESGEEVADVASASPAEGRAGSEAAAPPVSGTRSGARRAGPVTVAVVAVAALLVVVGPFRDRLVVATGSPLPEQASLVAQPAPKLLEPAEAAPPPLASEGEPVPAVLQTPPSQPAKGTSVPPSVAERPTSTPGRGANSTAGTPKRVLASQPRSAGAQSQGTAARRQAGKSTGGKIAASQRPTETGTTKARRQAQKPPATLPGAWEQPCREGAALEASCDVRMIAKGN